MGLGCLSRPRMVPNGPSVCLSESKSKLGLSRVTMELDKFLNRSPQGGLENIGYKSSNGPPGNYCKVPNKHIIGYVLVRQNGGSTKMFILNGKKCMRRLIVLYLGLSIICCNNNTWALLLPM